MAFVKISSKDSTSEYKGVEFPSPTAIMELDLVTLDSIIDLLSAGLGSESVSQHDELKFLPSKFYPDMRKLSIEAFEARYSKLRNTAEVLYSFEEIILTKREKIWFSWETVVKVCWALKEFNKFQVEFNKVLNHSDQTYWKDWTKNNKEFLKLSKE